MTGLSLQTPVRWSRFMTISYTEEDQTHHDHHTNRVNWGVDKAIVTEVNDYRRNTAAVGWVDLAV